MFSSNCFAFLLLAVLATPASVLCQGSDASCPQAGLLSEKLSNLDTALSSIKDELPRALDIINQQCPCLDGSSECFKTRATNFQTALQDLIDDVANATAIAPVDCPERTGAVFVASCNGTGSVAVVDPNGVIQNDFRLDEAVTAWFINPNGDTYGVAYITNPLEVLLRASSSDQSDILLGNITNPPLTDGAVGTGIVYDPGSGDVLVAITFPNSSLNGIYSFSRTSPPGLRLSLSGPTGQLLIYFGVVLMIDGQKIVALISPTDPPLTLVFFPVNIASFAVIDANRLAFCDAVSGSVWVVDLVTSLYRQLRVPSTSRCGSIGINPCNSLLYVVDIDDADIDIYNTTTYAFVETLTYSTTPSSCPSFGVDPTYWLS
ncbi:uncharacterized protein [Haliotis cracherodii]|uniref:uncharacterized protein n=1 Tax=Haliotis cracherodii TaxID=6455 RepID=UPI0039ED97AB